MQVVVTRCKDPKTQEQKLRVQLRAGDLSLAARPVASISAAMETAKTVCLYTGLTEYKLFDKIIKIA